jgi:eukaryotic-like serine/threonine-protein kinase
VSGRWQQIEQLYHAALERQGQQRAAFLTEACAGDDSLRHEVESLLAQGGGSENLLEQGALQAAAKIFSEDASRSFLGRRLGFYEIVSWLGAGGMGEVYEAHDTKLGRHVAIKVLPAAFVEDHERITRFQREARMLASLNHPNIATIHGLEQSGDVQYLVMELVPGETLAERLSGGALDIPEALKIAGQIAEALEAAHEKGVIHRDLKPANVKVTPEGRVKVLDFGLAKAFAGDAGLDLPYLPTLTGIGTAEGRILGTPAYMSPEQARGKAVDKRTDIWAFGCVLYELLTARPAFPGETLTDTLAAALEREPDWHALPATTPLKIRDLLRRCLHKDAARRLHDIADARIEIDEALDVSGSLSAVPVAAQPSSPGGHMLLWGLAALAAVGFAIALWGLVRRTRPPTRPVTRVAVTLPLGDRLSPSGDPAVALSPDGSRLVYAGYHAGSTQLYLRSMNHFEATPIPGTAGADTPFFSPDSQWVGFFAAGKLMKVSLTGGASLPLCSASAGSRGASWGPDDAIIFAPSTGSGLYRVSAAGGSPTALTVPDRKKGEFSHRWPEILPGGKALLFTIWGGAEMRIGLLSLETGERRILLDGGAYARYFSGHLIYARAGGLLAVPFDLKRLQVTGSPVSVLEGVWMNTVNGAVDLNISGDGSLVYVAAGPGSDSDSLVWVDRKGTAQPLPAPPRGYLVPRLSPDGQHLAVAIEDANPGLWLYDLARGTLTLLTASVLNPYQVWTRDGKRMTFRSPPFNLDWMPADGSGAPQRLMTSENLPLPGSWSPDGQVLAFSEQDPTTGWDIWTLRLDGEPKPQPFLRTKSNEDAPMFSPDGHWLAYQSDESGRYEIYVRPFPGPGGKWQISTEGGTEPVWAKNGRELFYRSANKMMAATVESKPLFAASKPRQLFEGLYDGGAFDFEPNYDVAPDGQRFLMLEPTEQAKATPQQINVVLNWSDELRRLAPAGKK